jgi:arsenite-transporting ATPase
MVIEEARRAVTELCLFDLPTDAVVMNRLLPEAAREEPFFRDSWRVQEERRGEVQDTFAPLPVLCAPLRADEVTGIERLRAHGEALFAGVEPDAVLCRAARLRFVSDAAGHRVELPLPSAERAGLDVAKLDDELVVRTATRRRVLRLPRALASRSLEGARFEGGVLVVRFGAPAAAPAGA